MSHRYTALQNSAGGHTPSQHDREAEMEAAFNGSDEEDDDVTETHPLNPQHSTAQTLSATDQNTTLYDFENVEYDYPPPGSPPPPSATALPNSIGNTNGFVPTLSHIPNHGPHPRWFKRVAAVIPSSVALRFGLTPARPTGAVGGGTNNDGVFANISAKPTPARVHGDTDDPYVVPEDSRQEAPPSYASAQADAVPPYWETTVHAPFTPDSMGGVVIDNLPTGSVFSFCWNLLVSISFQFVGFLLTYVLHTSHAARLGSRAGLGVTLIQYGFALRSRLDAVEWDWATDNENDSVSNSTWTTPTTNNTQQVTVVTSSATTEWFSFFLMTIGWFILLTSLLGFWRVKRWEHEIVASRVSSASSPIPATNFVSSLESNVGLRGMSRLEFLRQGFGFGTRDSEEREPNQTAVEENEQLVTMTDDEERARAYAAAMEADAQLRRHLREAGFL